MMLTLVQWLVLIGIIIGLISNTTYAINTIKGRTKPNKVSWLMWGIAPMLGAIIAYLDGVGGWTIIRVFTAGFFPFLVFLISFVNPKSYWKLEKFDYICGSLSMVALVCWLVADLPVLAIFLLVLTDLFASIPTVIKSWTNPETESALAYLLAAIGIALSFPAIPVWDIAHSSFQVYLVGINVLLVILISRKTFFSTSRMQKKRIR